MRSIASALVVSFALAFSSCSQATKSAGTNSEPAKKIGAAEAGQHYNETLIVTGKIAQVSVRPSVVILNLDKPSPDSPFSAVVFARATNRFGDLSKLQGKQVEIMGMVKQYRNKPEIILENTNQLVIVGNGAEVGGVEKK
jgi:DNA/RNA endonuclease YhcR with UshA esterase domain